MKTTFTLDNTTFTTNDNGTYFYAITSNGKIRIKKAQFEQARREFELRKAFPEETAEDKLDAMAENPEVVKTAEPKKTTKRTRKSKDIAYTYSENGQPVVTLTAKQVDFVKHLPDTCFWEHGLDSCIWVDCLCDEIGGQFAGKPMTVGAMISTLCEKGLGQRAKSHINGKKATSFALTELGRTVFATGWGLN